MVAQHSVVHVVTQNQEKEANDVTNLKELNLNVQEIHVVRNLERFFLARIILKFAGLNLAIKSFLSFFDKENSNE